MKATLLLVAIFPACTLSIFAADQPELKLKPALDAITPDGLLAHIKVLASDEFEGRAPGTKGEELSVKYISDQFKAIGLNPGNPDGSYTQEVPLTGIKSVPKMSFTLGSNTTELKYPDDYVASSARLQNEIKIDNSDVVFVGYGIVAPEYDWDDYKGVDVRGKTILMLINDPPIADPKDPSKLDETMFGGRAMTYYGRWTYKYEIATAKGAAAAIIVHETGPAGYPWAVIMGSSGRENMDLQTPDRNLGRVAIEGWITLESARRLCAASGQDLDALKKAALRKDFRPVRFESKASFAVQNKLREIASRNVIPKRQ